MNDLDHVASAISRETVWSFEDATTAARILASSGWTADQAIRGLLFIHRTGYISVESLWRGARHSGSIDVFLDAVDPPGAVDSANAVERTDAPAD